MTPRVSVLMSVYNGEQYLEEAIKSILNQTFSDFEFIIVDDGSFDSSPSLLARFQQCDPRVLIHRLDHNRGLSAALNFGIHLARGEYIARMDADDISLPRRLEKQVGFMNAHPEIGVCGTWAEILGASEHQIWKYPIEHDAIHACMIFACALVHPSVIFRSSEFKKHALHYDANIRYAQDYELWSRALEFTRFANIPEPLLNHRIHPASSGAMHAEEQHQTRLMIYRRFLSRIEVEFSQAELGLHEQLGLYQYQRDTDFLLRTRHWLERIAQANRRLKLIAPAVLDAEIGERWTSACSNSQISPYYLFQEILQSHLQFKNSAGICKIVRAFMFIIRKAISGRN